MLSTISWFASRESKRGSEDADPAEERVMLSRFIRAAVYLITAALAGSSVVVSLVDADPSWNKHLAPVSRSPLLDRQGPSGF